MIEIDLRLASSPALLQVLAEKLASNFVEALRKERREAEDAAYGDEGSWKWVDTAAATMAACKAGMDPQTLPAGGPREMAILAYGNPGTALAFKHAKYLSCDCDYGPDGRRTRVNVRLDGQTFRVPERQLELYRTRASPSTPSGGEMVTVRVELGRGAKATYRVPRSALK